MNTDQLQFAFAFLRTEPVAAARLLERHPPASVAAFLEKAPHQDAWRALHRMLPTSAAAVVEKLVEQRKVPAAVAMLTELSHSNATAILRAMSQATRRRALNGLPLKFKAACGLLLNYSPEEVGAWIETGIVVVPVEDTVAECLMNLKKKDRPGDGSRIYAVSRNRQLIGALSFIGLLQAQPHRTLASLVDKNHGVKSPLITNPLVKIKADRQLGAQLAACLHGRTSLSSALKSPLWDQRDCVPVANRAGELIGELHHHALRRALAIERRVDPVAPANLASELYQACSDSVAPVFDIFLGLKTEG